MFDFIQGDKFIGLADWTYAPVIRSRSDYDNLPSTLNLSLLKEKDIVYTHTIYVNKLFNLIQHTHKEIYIITHNSDDNINDTYNIPLNIVKWFTTNVNAKDERIQSIPIGLENDRWHPLGHKKEKIEDMLKTSKNLKNLVYVCHKIRTNLYKRAFIYPLFKGKSWSTVQGGDHAVLFDEYLDNVYNHRFVVCPEGNGMDTHRTWEALYMGTIPIEKRNTNNQFYTDLPICFVDEWEEITVDFLERWLIGSSWQTWNMKKLAFEYWKNKIQNHD